MRSVILYHPNSDHAGTVEDYAADYHRRNDDRQIDLVSLETTEGSDMAVLYDITSYPALLILSNDGQILQMWQGGMLPLMNEISAYAYA